MQIDVFILIAQLVNFGILLYVFQTFIAKKLNARLELRRARLKKLETAEEHYNQRISLAKQQKEEMLRAARQSTMTLMKESERIAQEKSQKIIAKANRDTFAIIEGARRSVEKERLLMLSQVKKYIINTSLQMNEKMFHSAGNNKDFIETELEALK